MPLLDIFNADAFRVVPLTDAIQKLKYVPGRLNELGLFAETGIPTTTAAIEERDGILVFVPPSPRGGPGMTVDKIKRTLRVVSVPHFQIDDAIMAEEVQGVRAWGNETAVEMVMDKVAERGSIFSQSFDATHELGRIGAVKGLVTYADGTTLNLFTLFNVTPQTQLHFNIHAPSPVPPAGTFLAFCNTIIRSMADELGGLPFSGIRALCGNAFYDDLKLNPDVRTTYLNWMAAEALRQAYVSPGQKIYSSFAFGGITWENYRGSDGNGNHLVPDDTVYLFPEGVPGLFRTWYAPADYMETVNTMGRRMYAKQWPMPNDKGINLEFQTNALHACTRPRVLFYGNSAAS